MVKWKVLVSSSAGQRAFEVEVETIQEAIAWAEEQCDLSTPQTDEEAEQQFWFVFSAMRIF